MNATPEELLVELERIVAETLARPAPDLDALRAELERALANEESRAGS
jgi:hypothetical protein